MKYVGIDWAREIHMVALVDADGKVQDEWEMAHTRRAVDGLLTRLGHEGGPGEVCVAIEAGAPLVVDQLAEAGYPVFVINPKQADRFRDRYSPAGSKDDRRDARVLANALRTDASRLTRLTPDSPLTRELKYRDRARRRGVEQRVRAGLQLREVLGRYYPALLALGRKMHDGLLLSLLEAYPTPQQARRARATRLERLLHQHRIRTLDVAQLRAVLREPALEAPDAIVAACRDETRHLVAQIRLLNEQIREAEEKLQEALTAHPDHQRVLALPGVGAHLAAGILAEAGDAPQRRADPKGLTVYSGAAPVTRASGTRKRPRKNGQRASVHVSMRRGCNRRLQTLLWLMARNSVRTSRWARAFVAHELARGKHYNSVIRALSYKWAKILAHLLATRAAYDEDTHIEHLIRNRVPCANKLDSPELENAA